MERLYRPNVAGLMIREDGKLLICERSREPGAWQFPRGGLTGRDGPEAVHREVCEEVGFLPSQYSIEESRGGYRYDYPPEVLDYVRKKRDQPFVGQEQEYFLCRLHAGRSGTHAGLPGVLRLQVDRPAGVQAGMAAGFQEGGVRQGSGGFLQCPGRG